METWIFDPPSLDQKHGVLPPHLIQEKQRKVQKELRQSLGINIDIPKSGGSGTSNDGTTARTFFKHYKESARWGVRNEVMSEFGSI